MTRYGISTQLGVTVLLLSSLLGGCPAYVTTQQATTGVRFDTSLGEIVIALNETAAPETTADFLQYVEDDYYDGTIFHRVFADFGIQGGELDADFAARARREPIASESVPGVKNRAWTIAMVPQPDGGSQAEFIINVADNPVLDASDNEPGYAVFGEVISGFDVVLEIAATPTETRTGVSGQPGGVLENAPISPVIINDAERVELNPGPRLTFEGELTAEQKEFEAQLLLRELLVELLAGGFVSVF